MIPRTVPIFTVFVLLPLAVGVAIYVGWRSTTLLVFDWMAALGVPAHPFRATADLPQPLLYSLPDGCWAFAGTSWMLLIWRRLHPWVFVFVVLGVGSEFGQALGLVPGTFGWNDVAFYVAGSILAYTGYYCVQTLSVGNRSVDHGRPCCR